MEARRMPTVSEIHRYPARPEGFSEPLFLTGSHRKEIAEHLADSGWLWKACESRASELREEEPVEVVRRERSGTRCVEVRRCPGKRRKGWVRRVANVVERWREVDRWWVVEGDLDHYAFRVSLEGGAVVDLSMDRTSREWRLIGVVD